MNSANSANVLQTSSIKNSVSNIASVITAEWSMSILDVCTKYQIILVISEVFIHIAHQSLIKQENR